MKKGMYEQSIELLQRVVNVSERATYFVSYLALAYGEAGNTNEVQKLLVELQDRSKKEYVAPAHFARIFLALKQRDQAFEELNRAVDEKNVMLYLRSSPEFDSIRPDARFAVLLKRLGL